VVVLAALGTRWGDWERVSTGVAADAVSVMAAVAQAVEAKKYPNGGAQNESIEHETGPIRLEREDTL
jgi:hypothetical protein